MNRTIKQHFVLAILLGLLAGFAHGQTLQIPEGVYSYSPTMFRSNATYVGAGVGKSIIRNTSTAPYSYSAQFKGLKNVKVSDVTFDGNGIEVNNGCVNITLEDFEVTNARRGNSNHQAIFLAGWSKQIAFRRFKIRNCSQTMQIYGCEEVTIEDFVFESSGYGLKWGTNGARSGIIRRGVIRWMRATMGLEIQNDDPTQDGLLIEDIAYVEPELYADDTKNGNAMAFSVPTWRMKGITGRRVYADGLAWVIDSSGKRTGERRRSMSKDKGDPITWKGLRVGIEVGGDRPTWTEYWMRNLNDPVAITSSTAAQVYNGRVENCLEAVDFGSPANGVAAAQVGSRLENNGPQVALPAQGGWSLVGVSSGTSAPPPPATIVTGPSPSETFAPGQTVTITAAGRNLRIEVDLENDGRSELAIVNGTSATVTIPAYATDRTPLRARVVGDGGTVEEYWSIVPTAPPPPTEVEQLQAQVAKLAEELTAATGQLAGLQADVTAKASTIQQQAARVQALEAAVNEAAARLRAVQN